MIFTTEDNTKYEFESIFGCTQIPLANDTFVEEGFNLVEKRALNYDNGTDLWKNTIDLTMARGFKEGIYKFLETKQKPQDKTNYPAKCFYCRRILNSKTKTLEHILPKSTFKYLTFAHYNLVLACRRCNENKSTHILLNDTNSIIKIQNKFNELEKEHKKIKDNITNNKNNYSSILKDYIINQFIEDLKALDRDIIHPYLDNYHEHIIIEIHKHKDNYFIFYKHKSHQGEETIEKLKLMKIDNFESNNFEIKYEDLSFSNSIDNYLSAIKNLDESIELINKTIENKRNNNGSNPIEDLKVLRVLRKNLIEGKNRLKIDELIKNQF